MKISVVMPVYNEIGTIDEILNRVQAVAMEKEIVIVDDYSTDGTRERLKKIEQGHGNVKVFYHERNQGKGAALRTGFEGVTGDFLVAPTEFYFSGTMWATSFSPYSAMLSPT